MLTAEAYTRALPQHTGDRQSQDVTLGYRPRPDSLDEAVSAFCHLIKRPAPFSHHSLFDDSEDTSAVLELDNKNIKLACDLLMQRDFVDIVSSSVSRKPKLTLFKHCLVPKFDPKADYRSLAADLQSVLSNLKEQFPDHKPSCHTDSHSHDASSHRDVE